MAMLQKTLVNSIDVSDYLRTWKHQEEWDTSVDTITIVFAPSISDAVTIIVGQEVKVTRGFTTSTDKIIFEGQITQYNPFINSVTLVCKGRMYDAIKSGRTKSWEKDIDTEAGVGSEIFKSIADNSEIVYTAASIVSTGTATTDKINTFIQNDEDDFQKMNELAENYNYTINYNYDLPGVEFKPKGYTIYPATLTVGTDIPGQIKWKNNMEQLINKVKIQGATVYDKIIQTFAGPATKFDLIKTPEDTEVFINHATTDDLQTRGQKDIGTLGTDFDYYVNVESKKITFNANVSDVWVRYGAQVPLPIILSNQTSIDNYGGPNKIPHFKKFSFTDIKDPTDGEGRGRAILNKFSTPFIEAIKVPVNDSVISVNGDIKPGDVVRIIDPFTGEDVSVFVKEVERNWPHINDFITVGDEIWRTEDWQSAQMKKINLLFNELNKNQDILIHAFDLNRTVNYDRRYMYLEKKDRSGDGVNVFIFGSPIFGVLGTSELGESSATWATVKLLQGNNIYKEYVYDTVFKSSTYTTATWNTTTKEITFTSGQVMETEKITLGTAYSTYKVEFAALTGSVLVEVSPDNRSSWETVTLDTSSSFVTSATTGVILRVTENSGGGSATLANSYDIYDDYEEPAIKITLEE